MDRKWLNFLLAGGVVGAFFGMYTNTLAISLPAGLFIGGLVGRLIRKN